MDSHETDSKWSRNFNKSTEQVVSDLSVDATSSAILNSSANTNEYKGNDVTVQRKTIHLYFSFYHISYFIHCNKMQCNATNSFRMILLIVNAFILN